MIPFTPARWIALGAVLSGAALWTACGSGGSPPENPVPVQEEIAEPFSGESESRIAPGFSLQDIQGKTVSLSDFKGKVVFIDFWATWCPPCRISSPEVEKIHHLYQGKNVQVLGLSVDEDPEDVRRYVERKKIGYPVLLAGDSDASQAYGVDGIPHFALVDQEGRLVRAWNGYAPGYGRDWRLAIDKLLGS